MLEADVYSNHWLPARR